MKLTSSIVIALFTCCCTTFAQPDSLWTKFFDVGANDIAKASVITSDTSILIAGYSTDPARNDSGTGWVLKLNRDGDSLWFQEYGDFARVNSIINTSNGFAICGRTEDFQARITRCDANGNSLWTQTRSTQAEFNDLCLTHDNGFAACGYRWIDTGSRQDFLVVKYFSTGTFSWQRITNYAGWDQAEAIALATDNDLVVVGTTVQIPNAAMLVRLTSGGFVQSSQEFAPNADTYIRGLRVAADSSAGCFIATTHEPSDGTAGFGLQRLAVNNGAVWTINNLEDSERIELCDLLKLSDEDLVVCGVVEDESRKVFLERRHANDNPGWSVEFDLNESQVYSAATISDTEFIVSGADFSEHDNTNIFIMMLGPGLTNPIFNLRIQREGESDDIKLSWNAIPTAVSYKIYRSTETDFYPESADYIGQTSQTFFEDSGVLNLPASTHFYVVTALNEAGAVMEQGGQSR